MPVITALKVQQKRGNRISVFLDQKFAFGCNQKVAERFRLRVGQVMPQDLVDAVLEGQIQQECFDKAVSYLARRMHSRVELRRKLLKAEFRPEVVEYALSRLEDMSYINDAEFARLKLQQSQRKLIGERRAMQELMRSGVKSEVAKEAVGEHFNSAETKNNAQKLIEKKLPTLRRLEPVKAKRRLIGLLQRRGFDYETIMPLVNRAFAAGDEFTSD